MKTPELVFAETSPYGSNEALIEQDDEVAYFYLRSLTNQQFGLKSCWVRNLIEAPEQLDRKKIEAGNGPALPAQFCRERSPQPRLDQKNLRVVWFEPGDGAALVENGEVIAVIPAWSGHEGFEGYARDCQAGSPFCWPLSENPSISQRVESADQFWKSWEDESLWRDHEPRLITAYESVLGTMESYYAIDGGHWPPKTLGKFRFENHTVLATIGISLCPQPMVETVFESASHFRRFELIACFDENLPDSLVEAFGRYLGGQSELPWSQHTFLAHGHSVSCDLLLKSQQLPDFSSLLLASQDKLNVTPIELPEIQGDPINLLWTVPVFENERKFIQETNNFSLLNDIIGKQSMPVIASRSMVV